MKILSYALFLVLLAFTLFNLFATATAKRRKNVSKVSFAVALKPVEEALLKEQKRRGLRFGVVKRMANDQNQVFIFCYDSQAKVFALGSDGTVVVGDAKGLDHIYKEYKVGRFGRVAASSVGFRYGEEDYLIPIATKPFWRRGIVGSVLYETTEEFHQALKDAESDAKGSAGKA